MKMVPNTTIQTRSKNPLTPSKNALIIVHYLRILYFNLQTLTDALKTNINFSLNQ